MDLVKDLRLNEDIFKRMIGKQFYKYKCDPFVFTNTVTGIVGLYIGEKVFELKNEQTAFQYFDSMDDVALWNIKEVNDPEIHSVFANTEQIDTLINQNINSITLANEHQIVNIHTRPWKFLNIRKVPVFGRYLQVQMPKKATFRIQIKRFFHICFHEGLIPCPFITKLTIFFIHSFLHTSQTLDM